MAKIRIIEKVCTEIGAHTEIIGGKMFIIDDLGELPVDNLTAEQIESYYFGDGSLVPSIIY